jgi:hypothetical protein
MKRRMRRRVGNVDAAAQYRDGATARVERAPMRGRVDAEGHAADDDGTSAHEHRGHLVRDAVPAGGGMARTDNPDSPSASQSRIAQREEETGCIGQLEEGLRISRFPLEQDGRGRRGGPGDQRIAVGERLRSLPGGSAATERGRG